jgi:membrane-associated protease RseP (regulator of RpoE activity)
MEIYHNSILGKPKVKRLWHPLYIRSGSGAIFGNYMKNSEFAMVFQLEDGSYKATNGKYPGLDQIHDMWIWDNTAKEADDLIFRYGSHASEFIKKDRDYFLRKPNKEQDGFDYEPFPYPHPLTLPPADKMGLLVRTLTPERAKSLGLEKTIGVLVEGVVKGSPAEKTGFKKDDVVVELKGAPVADLQTFCKNLATMKRGANAAFKVFKGETRTLTVRIWGIKEKTEIPSAAESARRLGFTVSAGEKGVLIGRVEAGSAAAKAGVKPGAIIQEVNHRAVKTLEEFRNAPALELKWDVIVLRLREGEVTRFIVLRL